jgi:hypothetical protein
MLSHIVYISRSIRIPFNDAGKQREETERDRDMQAASRQKRDRGTSIVHKIG